MLVVIRIVEYVHQQQNVRDVMMGIIWIILNVQYVYLCVKHVIMEFHVYNVYKMDIITTLTNQPASHVHQTALHVTIMVHVYNVTTYQTMY